VHIPLYALVGRISHTQSPVRGCESFKIDNCTTAKFAHACKYTKETLHRTNTAVSFNKVSLYTIVGRIFHNNATVFLALKYVVAHSAMFCLQNDTMWILYAYHSDDPFLRPGTKSGALLYHGSANRGSRALYLVERVNLEKPLLRDVLFWDLRNPVVSNAQWLLKFYHFR
jgi:hypothetical protein